MFKAIKRLDNDERGINTLETVALLAVAAIVLVAIKFFWGRIKIWTGGQMDTAIGTDNKSNWSDAGAPAAPNT